MWKTITKFDLEHCDLPTTVWNLSFLLKPICLLISSRYYTRINILCYIWTVLIFISYIFVWMFSKIWYLLVKCVENGDIDSAFFVFALVITSQMGPLKLFFMHLYNDKMKEIVDDYLNIDEQVTPGTRFSKNILITMRQVKKRAIIFWVIIMGNAVVYIAKPLLSSERNFMNNIFTLYGFDPITETPNYEMAYTLMAFSLFTICYPAANITGLHITLVGYTEAQMLALAADITNLWSDAEQHYQETTVIKISNDNDEGADEIDVNNYPTKNVIMNEFIKDRLNHIALIHSKNVHLLKKIEILFRAAIVVEFLLLTIGMISYLLAGLEKTYSAIPFTLVQVAMDCLTGQNVMDASIVFENAVYDSKWENFNVSNRKAVLLILKNSQKNMTLSAGGVAMLNFNCLMTILRMTYSAYTTLLSTVK